MTDPMEGRIVRFEELTQGGTPLAFIDCVLPGHHRMNYAVVGDTAVEDPDFNAAFTTPHRFQVGVFECPPGSGPAWHTHEYVELFIPLTGDWRFTYGRDAEGYNDPDNEVHLGPWDAISFPAGLWRSFANSPSSRRRADTLRRPQIRPPRAVIAVWRTLSRSAAPCASPCARRPSSPWW